MFPAWLTKDAKFKEGWRRSPVIPYRGVFIFGTVPYVAMVLKSAGAPGTSSISWPEALLPFLGHVICATSIACKYAYYSKSDYMKVMGRGEWNSDMTYRRMLLGGWSDPTKIKGLLDDLYSEAYESASLDIYDYEFKGIANREASRLVKEEWARGEHGKEEGEEGNDIEESSVGNPWAKMMSTEDDTVVSAATIMMGVIGTAFAIPNPRSTRRERGMRR